MAKYYEDLYRAREEKHGYSNWTKTITEENEKTRSEVGKERQTITKQDLQDAIKKLKRNKAMGPDGIPNELFIEADETTKEIILKIINQIHIDNRIPNQWKKGMITRLYKGKGEKRKMLQTKRHHSVKQFREGI